MTVGCASAVEIERNVGSPSAAVGHSAPLLSSGGTSITSLPPFCSDGSLPSIGTETLSHSIAPFTARTDRVADALDGPGCREHTVLYRSRRAVTVG